MGGLVTQYVAERKNQIETSDQPVQIIMALYLVD